MPEVALNLPLDTSEIRRVILDRLEKCLEKNSLLGSGMAYPGFSYEFKLLLRLEHPQNLETLVWDKHVEGEVSPEATVEPVEDTYQSQTPNQERKDHDLPFTVETRSKGRYGFKKIRVKAETETP